MSKRKFKDKAVVAASDAARKERILQTVFPPMVTIATIDSALNDQRANLFQAMGIVRMAIDTIREPPLGQRSIVAAWTALDGAYALLSSVADRLQDSETMLAKEVPRGEY